MSEIAATATGRKRGRKPVEVTVSTMAEGGDPVAEAAAEPTAGRDSGAGVSPELSGGIEALLFSAERALGWARIAAAVGLIDAEAATEAAADDESAEEGVVVGKGKSARRATGPAAIVREAIAKLNAVYEQTGRAFRIEQVAGGYRVMTLAKHAAVLERFHGGRERSALSKAALETLAIVAYKQPLTRAGLEAIRGVACGEILRALLERRLITIVGRAEELGRPILYGTSKRFLETFGLGSLKDLPTVEELRMRARGEGVPENGTGEPDGTEAE
jgi:segregation and condensation protein B